MIVLGVDPGSEVTGYGVIETTGGKSQALAWGTIRAEGAATFPAVLRRIHEGVTEVATRFRPEFAAVEDVFYAANVRSALKLGQTRGAILLSLELAGIQVFSYTPLAVKKALVGYGRATKEQVQEMVKLILGLRGQDLPMDASDALAAALCHAQSYGTRLRIERAAARKRN
jgi:crossover junction endodeoxyribonuclease RuvC